MSALEAIAEIQWTCNACPTQAEGTLRDGRFFYFWGRRDYWTLGLSTVSVNDAVDSTLYVRSYPDVLTSPTATAIATAEDEYGAGYGSAGDKQAWAALDRMLSRILLRVAEIDAVTAVTE